MDSTQDLNANNEAVLYSDVSDAALEAAADSLKNPAFSMPNAPTVSIVFSCCSNDGAA
ncbi:MAG TPA: hypothetical protein VH206_06610 [Xanthobacteraceae bacterium]|jgi:hypothetical protein|nr:hypothetical protein [Xanthobacteraceae bacterium]